MFLSWPFFYSPSLPKTKICHFTFFLNKILPLPHANDHKECYISSVCLDKIVPDRPSNKYTYINVYSRALHFVSVLPKISFFLFGLYFWPCLLQKDRYLFKASVTLSPHIPDESCETFSLNTVLTNKCKSKFIFFK